MGTNGPMLGNSQFKPLILKENIFITHHCSDENGGDRENVSAKKDRDPHKQSASRKRRRDSSGEITFRPTKRRQRVEVDSPSVEEDSKELPLTVSSGDEGLALSVESLFAKNFSSPESYPFFSLPDTKEDSPLRTSVDWSYTPEDQNDIFNTAKTGTENSDVSRIPETDEDAFDPIKFSEDNPEDSLWDSSDKEQVPEIDDPIEDFSDSEHVPEIDDPIEDFSDSEHVSEIDDTIEDFSENEEPEIENAIDLPQSTQKQGMLPKRATTVSNVSFFRQRNGEMLQQACNTTEQENFLPHWHKVR